MATQTHTSANDANNRRLKDGPDPNAPTSQVNMRCPDPSAHQTKNSSLQDHASAAALYSTRNIQGRDPLGSDGKLSSASAATSLKHARAQDLPSYPIVGIDARSSAGTAANLAHANQKSPEWWKPEQSTAAGQAALLAHDHKSAPVWKPEASAAGSKAALLAHKDGVKMNLWAPEASADGNSAANIAMRKKTPEVEKRQAQNKPNGALIAATGAVSNSGRKRAQSNPIAPQYPDSKNSARNALSAATMAHSPSMRANSRPPSKSTDSNRLGSGAMEAARIQHSKSISRDMYTSNPPVALEVDEKRHNDALRASAISMAKKMYDVQQSNIDQARVSRSQAQSGATSAHGAQPQPGSDADIKQQAIRYIGIQEAAQKLAAERLAKIGPDENAAFRSYYGYEKPRSKLSIRRGRNRASSNPEPAEDESSGDDEFRSRRIRSQMSQLNKQVAEVDAKKQEQDRKNLLAAAQRKVQAQMLGMDKKIFDDTGKMSPAMIDEWDAKARAKAAANSEARMEHHGKIHIGHGKYVDQADVNAVAQARIQPTLDEISDKTEKRRAEEEERRLEMEERKRQTQAEKDRAAELKAEEKRIKDEEKRVNKTRSAEEKAAAKQEKEVEKEKRAEEKRLQKEEKRKSRDGGALGATAATGAAVGATTPANINVDAPVTTEESNDEVQRGSTPLATALPAPEPDYSNPTSPTSPTSPKSDSKGIKSFLNKFKRRSKHSAASADTDKPGFIGGNALRQSSTHSRQESVPPSPAPEPTEPTGISELRKSSERRYSDVSSISTGRVSSNGRGRSPKRTVTGLSADSGSTDYEEARDDFDEKLAPPVSFTADADAARKGSPNRDSKFHEVGI